MLVFQDNVRYAYACLRDFQSGAPMSSGSRGDSSVAVHLVHEQLVLFVIGHFVTVAFFRCCVFVSGACWWLVAEHSIPF